MPLTLFHTAQVHCATFDTLRDRIAPGVELVHHVRTDWLAHAQTGISSSLESEIMQVVSSAAGKVICTCSTIGPIAEQAGAIRIDQPMMQAAAEISGPVLVVYCLESTKKPSLSLLQSALDAADNPAKVHLLALPHLWPEFEAENTQAFATGIATEVCKAAQNIDPLGCAVLTQASMASAATLLADLPFPVLSSPELALRAALG